MAQMRHLERLLKFCCLHDDVDASLLWLLCLLVVHDVIFYTLPSPWSCSVLLPCSTHTYIRSSGTNSGLLRGATCFILTSLLLEASRAASRPPIRVPFFRERQALPQVVAPQMSSQNETTVMWLHFQLIITTSRAMTKKQKVASNHGFQSVVGKRASAWPTWPDFS